MSMKKLKRVLPFSLAIILASVSLPVTALADSAKVVTLGANLSDEQKASMYKYFGTSADQVDTNTDERKYMEGIATESQIGTRTYSCSYVEPTDSGGIQVKVANLTFVTSSMIASTLLTSGVLTPVTILKAGHHGSATSSSEEFIEKLSPSVTILSYGRKNRYGHPAEKVRERLLEHGSKIYETGLSGAVMVRADGKKLKIKTMLPLDTD